MDQSFICGLGNIYVNEALFISKISPGRMSFKIKDNEIILLIKSIKKILKKFYCFWRLYYKRFSQLGGEIWAISKLLQGLW